jgi:hypothetical protein
VWGQGKAEEERPEAWPRGGGWRGDVGAPGSRVHHPVRPSFDVVASVDPLPEGRQERETNLARGCSERPRRPSRARPFYFFFYFLFSNFLSLTIFLAHKLCVQLVFMEKDMHTTRRFAKKIMHITCR